MLMVIRNSAFFEARCESHIGTLLHLLFSSFCNCVMNTMVVMFTHFTQT